MSGEGLRCYVGNNGIDKGRQRPVLTFKNSNGAAQYDPRLEGKAPETFAIFSLGEFPSARLIAVREPERVLAQARVRAPVLVPTAWLSPLAASTCPSRVVA
jgi:hypothetical protein